MQMQYVHTYCRNTYQDRLVFFFLILLKGTVHFSRSRANLHWAVMDGVTVGNLRGHHFTI